MQESWQMFLKPAMSTPHVDAAFQAGMQAAATSMAGRVLFPYPRWSDIEEIDGRTHGKCASDNLVTMAHTAANAKQMPTEGLGYCKVSGSLVDATQGGPSKACTSGLVCTTETKTGGQNMTTTNQNLGMMAMGAEDGGVKADGHIASAFSSSDLSSIRSSQYSDNPLGIMTTMAHINHINEMNIKQDMQKIITQSNSKNDMPINNTHDGGVSNSKCKQKMVHHHLTVHGVPRCQIDGCKQDLSKAKKEYHRRHKVCEMHSKASSVVKCGLHQRFCQQCSRFHVVGDFDDAKRSCRRRLEGHNKRRRKSVSQGFGNLVGLSQIMQHRLMAAAAIMVPLQQQVLLNQEKNNYKMVDLHQIQNEQSFSISKNAFQFDFDKRLLSLLAQNTKDASLSSSSSLSSSPSSIFNHGDTTCALSLLSCNACLDQPLAQSIKENPCNQNISSNLTTPNNFTFSNATNLASMMNLNANNYVVRKYPQPSQSMNSTIGKVESSSIVELAKELPYSYLHANYWKNLGSLQNLEQQHNDNLITELLRHQQAYPTNQSSHI